ncbi:efflux RND transporter periplasmic adaptor subunit [Gottfriedia acidiceleris]|uniref:Efflux RND transporter periplasmic adaptor subunit n=1 Tax=Gottfriedia acidiceleris TaxID=371036 RepID=A0ABY4JME3_9BACI|nr:efflux RND transporter periplasmic adaptor subunit [Gottfriedia acidiceleris]UPM54637.1 efflux RND transporter periplasmic adaptor subunit [Gottfriedia acidiceleris]
MQTAKRIDEEKEQVKVITPRQKKIILMGIIVLFIVSVVLSVAVVEIKKSKSKTLQFISPTVKNFTKTETVSGSVVQSQTETIYVNPTKGSINEIFVKEGDTVTKGQKLFSYEDTTIAAELGQAEVNKKLAETTVTQKNDQIVSLEKDIQNAISASTSTSNTSDVNKTDKNAANITNTSEIQSLQAELNTTKEELNAAHLKVEQYTLEVEKLKAQQESLIVNSNNDGVVLNLNKSIGQGYKATDKQQISIMQIASNEPFQIEGKLTEEEKAKVEPGQAIKVTSKVVADKNWKGSISEVSNYPMNDQSTNQDKNSKKEAKPYYTFRATLDSQENLYPGYETNLEVVVQSKDLLAIPVTSVKGSGKSKYVYVLKKGTIYKQNVKTGQKQGKYIAILKGVKEGDKVGKNPSWTVRPGTKIDLNK